MLWIGNVALFGFMGLTYMLFRRISHEISPQGDELIGRNQDMYRIARMDDGVLTPEERLENEWNIALVEELKTLRHCKRYVRAMLVMQACVEIALAIITIRAYA